MGGGGELGRGDGRGLKGKGGGEGGSPSVTFPAHTRPSEHMAQFLLAPRKHGVCASCTQTAVSTLPPSASRSSTPYAPVHTPLEAG